MGKREDKKSILCKKKGSKERGFGLYNNGKEMICLTKEEVIKLSHAKIIDAGYTIGTDGKVKL